MNPRVGSVGRQASLVAGIVCAGCTGIIGGGGDDDNPPIDAPSDDAMRAGLTILWESKPSTIPSGESNNRTILRAMFNLGSLRIVSDAGPRTLAPISVEWATGKTPMNVRIDDAPSGLYSRCLFDLAPLAPSPYAYEIEGEVDIGGEDRDFVIRDTMPISISIDYSVNLPPGGNMTIPIEFDVGALVDIVDWSQVPYTNSRYTVDATSSQLPKVRMLLDDSIDFDDD